MLDTMISLSTFVTGRSRPANSKKRAISQIRSPCILALHRISCKHFLLPAGDCGVMSEAGGETIAHPADRHESIRTLLRAGRNDEAIVRLCAIHITRPSDLVARELLFDAYF